MACFRFGVGSRFERRGKVIRSDKKIDSVETDIFDISFEFQHF